MKNKHQNAEGKANHIGKMCDMLSKPLHNFKNFLGRLLSKGGKKHGFTLIELLIVIAIIGILAVSLLPSVLGAPARARDAARKADVNNIIAAVESFYAANGHYPSTSGCIDPAATSGDMGLLQAFFKGAKAPTPPSGTTAGCENKYYYCVLTSPNQYSVAALMETDGSTKGYRTTAASGDTDCASVSTAADGLGKYYVSVQ